MHPLRALRVLLSPNPEFPDTTAELMATKYTPDVWKIQQYTHQLIFVFDHMKKNHLRNSLLGPGAVLRWPAYTLRRYHLWQPPTPFEHYISTEATSNLPRFPSAKIRGEIWKIPSDNLLALDEEYSNTVEFQRQRVRMIVPSRTVEFVKDHTIDPDFGVMDLNATHRRDYTGSSVKTSSERVALVRCWMYIGKSSFWDPLISAYDGYKPVETFEAKQRRWLNQYYYIRRPDTPAK